MWSMSSEEFLKGTMEVARNKMSRGEDPKKIAELLESRLAANPRQIDHLEEFTFDQERVLPHA